MQPTDNASDLRLEFRIPISPTRGFFAQVRLFHFALQKLGQRYADARLRVIVGDKCDLSAVISENSWSRRFNVIWERVPDALYDVSGIWGTANWRMSIGADDVDVIVLSDADTVLLKDVDCILDDFRSDRPVVRGHIAHYPPPLDVGDTISATGSKFWPKLLREYGSNWPEPWLHYSMDIENQLPLTPPYFNLGFVVMNKAALARYASDIHWTEEWLRRFYPSNMRCQIALTLIAAAHDMDAAALPAIFNAANDPAHFQATGMTPDEVRVLHYLREDEFDRANFLLPEQIDNFLARELKTVMNPELQELVRAWRATW